MFVDLVLNSTCYGFKKLYGTIFNVRFLHNSEDAYLEAGWQSNAEVIAEVKYMDVFPKSRLDSYSDLATLA